MLAMMQSMPGLIKSLSQLDDFQEHHDRRVDSNVSQDNTQLQILRLLQEIQRSLTANAGRSNYQRNRKPGVKTPYDSAEWRTKIRKH